MCTWKLFVISFVATGIGIPIAIFTIGKLSGRGYTYIARKSNDSSYFTRYYQVEYRSVEEIYEYMHDLVTNYTFFCKLHTIGHTGHKGELAGYPIYMVSLSSGFTKPIILVIGGVYANDWTSATSALFLINQLLTNCKATGTLVTSYNWMFIPILNPDGYNYSKSSLGNHWIKNIARWSMDATGVNLNYNFATNWKANYNFHEDTYPGTYSFSEKESQILRDFVLNTKNHIEMIVILRSPTKRFQINRSCITFPWSHTIQKVHNWYILQFLASLASSTTNQKLHSSYDAMQSENYEKNQSGTIDDWLYSVARIKKVFTIQRNFKASEVYSPYDTITKVGEEVFSIIKKIAMNALMHPNDIKEQQPNIIDNDI